MQAWFWLGLMGMIIGALYFGLGAYSARKLESGRAEVLFQINFFVCALAAVLYLVLATGYGATEGGEGPGTRTVWARYVTYALSAPLLLLNLTYLGRSRLTTTTALLGASTLMIGTGFIATVVPDASKYLWYLISCTAFLAIVYLLLIPYRQEAKTRYPDGTDAFNRLVGVLLVLWALYPVVWILSPEGWGVFGPTGEASGFTVLDVLAKVGFGLLVMGTLAQLEGERVAPADLGQTEQGRAL